MMDNCQKDCINKEELNEYLEEFFSERDKKFSLALLSAIDLINERYPEIKSVD